jgi:hypothetical protein
VECNCIPIIYDGPSTRIRVGDKFSETFTLKAGIKQGSVLSPILFVIYVNDILEDLAKTGRGLPLLDSDLAGSRDHLPGIMFVDDLILAAATMDSMMSLYRALKSKLPNLRVIFNPAKTKLVAPKEKHTALDFLKQENLDASCLCDGFKYLGVQLYYPFDPQSWERHTGGRISSAWKAYHALANKGLPTDGRYLKTSLHIYKHMIQPILFYGAEVWSPNTKLIQKLDKVQANIVKTILGLPKEAPNRWALWEAGITPAAIFLDKVKLLAWWKHQNWALSYHVKTHVIKNNYLLLDTIIPVFFRWNLQTYLTWHGSDNLPSPRALINISRRAWQETLKQKLEAMNHLNFREWCMARDLLQKPPRLPFFKVCSVHGLDAGDVVAGLNRHQSTLLLRARADCIGFPADCRGRKQAAAEGIGCLWPPCAEMGCYDTLSHSLVCPKPLANTEKRRALISTYEEYTGAPVQDDLSTDPYSVTAELLSCQEQNVQTLLIEFLEEQRKRRGFA